MFRDKTLQVKTYFSIDLFVENIILEMTSTAVFVGGQLVVQQMGNMTLVLL